MKLYLSPMTAIHLCLLSNDFTLKEKKDINDTNIDKKTDSKDDKTS